MNSSDEGKRLHSILPALVAILVMEWMIALHTLWRDYPFMITMLMIWTGLTFMLSRDQAPRYAVSLTLGAVIGEAAAYFIAVPWNLNSLCMTRHRYGLPETLFLRFFCVLLAIWAFAVYWKMERAKPKESVLHTSIVARSLNYGSGIAAILLAFFLIFHFGLVEKIILSATNRVMNRKLRIRRN